MAGRCLRRPDALLCVLLAEYGRSCAAQHDAHETEQLDVCPRTNANAYADCYCCRQHADLGFDLDDEAQHIHAPSGHLEVTSCTGSAWLPPASDNSVTSFQA